MNILPDRNISFIPVLIRRYGARWFKRCSMIPPMLMLSTAQAADRDRVEGSDYVNKVTITLNGTESTVTAPTGVTVTYGSQTSQIIISSTIEGVEYVLSGTSSSGYVQITSTYESKVTLNGLSLTSTNGPALSTFSSERSFIVLAAGTTNSLTDSSSSSRTGTGALYGSGALIFGGDGKLSVAGMKSHGIASATSIRTLGGNVTVSTAVKDAIHVSSYFQMDQGSLNLTATGDGIDAGSGYAVLNGGDLTIQSTQDDTKGITADGTITITGGTIQMTVSGVQSKAIKSKAAISISGGTQLLHLSGAVYLESVTSGTLTYVDPSYCTGIKTDTDINISGGAIAIYHTGTAGKGISADGNITISGGKVEVMTSGAPSATFTNSSSATDIAACDCIKADGNLTITGGTINTTSTGNAGDAISCEGVAIIGITGVSSTPVISANTTGARVLLSGSGDNADYSNPKAFSSEGNLTMYGGVFKATTQQAGGEGMESKATLTIAGGTVEITAYDDCINATTNVTISGGSIYCYSSGNDGIDSNGTMTITGGVIVSSGTNSPEEGFDCDQNTFSITGGILIGTGGATSTPTASTSTQRSVIYKGAGTADVILHVRSSSGASNVVYKIPRTYSGGGGGGSSSTAMTMLFSNPSIASGTTYTILSGATVSGGTEFHGLYTGATVSGGTTLKTFTPSSMVTTVQ